MKPPMPPFAAIVLFAFLLFGCNELRVGKAHPKDMLNWPVAVVADPDGQHVYVVNSNFDQFYLGGTIAVIDLDSGELQSEATARVPGFGGVLAPRTREDGTFQDLLMASRLSDSVYRIEVGGGGDSGPVLRCNDDEEANTCDENHSLALTSELGFEVEPYASTYIPTADGRGVLAVTGLSDGYLYLFSVDGDGALSEISTLVVGGGVQSILFHPVTGRLVFSHRFFPLITTVQLAIGEDAEGDLEVVLGTPRLLLLPSVSTIADFGRELALDLEGFRIALSWRSPSSVMILEPDVSVKAGYRLVQQIPVGKGASGLVFANFGPDSEARLFVNAFKEDKLYVIDPDSGVTLKILKVGTGPYAVTAIDKADGTRKAIITANFEANTLSVIEGDATKEAYLSVTHELSGTSD